MIKIDKNIPMPEPQYRAGRAAKYPWAQMERGDSFHLSCPETKTLDAFQRTLSRCGKVWGKSRDRKFATRREGDGVRVWRVA